MNCYQTQHQKKKWQDVEKVSSTKIQASYKRYACHKKFSTLKDNIIFIQRLFPLFSAKQKLIQLKKEAKWKKVLKELKQKFDQLKEAKVIPILNEDIAIPINDNELDNAPIDDDDKTLSVQPDDRSIVNDDGYDAENQSDDDDDGKDDDSSSGNDGAGQSVRCQNIQHNDIELNNENEHVTSAPVLNNEVLNNENEQARFPPVVNNEQNELESVIQQTIRQIWVDNGFTNLQLGTYLREKKIPFNQNKLTELKKTFTQNQLTIWKHNKSLRSEEKKRKRKDELTPRIMKLRDEGYEQHEIRSTLGCDINFVNSVLKNHDNQLFSINSVIRRNKQILAELRSNSNENILLHETVTNNSQEMINFNQEQNLNQDNENNFNNNRVTCPVCGENDCPGSFTNGNSCPLGCTTSSFKKRKTNNKKD